MSKRYKTERMKVCKSKTGLFVPCTVRDFDWLTTRSGVVGKGYMVYNHETEQVSAYLTDNDGNELPMKSYQIEQDADNAFLVVYSESVN